MPEYETREIFGKDAGPLGNRSRNVPEMTAGCAALVGLVDRYLRDLLDPFTTLLEVHKLLYFMQAAGEPLKLKFAEGPYGPYAENLWHVLNAMEGRLVSGYADGGDAPDKQLELVPGALDDARTFLADKTTTETRFERVSDLIEGFESSFGLELLAAVHWIVGERQTRTFDDIMERTYAWNERKQQFSRRQLGIAVDVLSRKQWIRKFDLPDTHAYRDK